MPEDFQETLSTQHSHLSDVYSNLLECGFHSCYWEQVLDYLALLYGIG